MIGNDSPANLGKTSSLGTDSPQIILDPKKDLGSTQAQTSADFQLGLMEKA